MHPILLAREPEFQAAIEHFKTELNSIRGNRAHPSIVEDVKVEVYGSEMRLKELASITTPEPRVITIQPWDKNALKDIERSLQKADLNVGIQSDGIVVRVTFPPLTEESRQAILKVLGQKLEAGKVQVRHIREAARDAVLKAEKAKEMSEDDRYKAQEDLDELTKKYQEQLESLSQRKEEEVTTI